MSADPVARPAVTERLTAWVAAAGVPFRVLDHAPVRTSAEAATVRGTPLEAGAKALAVRADDRPVHLVLPADRWVDNARLRALLDARRLRFVTPNELAILTGYVPGAVPLFRSSATCSASRCWSTRSSRGTRRAPSTRGVVRSRSRCGARISSASRGRASAASPRAERDGPGPGTRVAIRRPAGGARSRRRPG